MHHIKQGFTLIELSIALVIIGLVVAGVVVGQDLIHAANVRGQVSQLEKYSAAENTFKTKYNCLPGDCAIASNLGLGTDGNGNGALENWDQAMQFFFDLDGDELQNYWYHLGQAGLIETTYPLGAAPGVNSPALKLPGQGSIYTALYGNTPGGIWVSDSYITTSSNSLHKHAWLLISNTEGSSAFSVNTVYSPYDAESVDVKIDDGQPLSGVVLAMTGFASNHCAKGDNYCISQTYSTNGVSPSLAGTANSCINDSGATPLYNVQSNTCTSADATCLCGLVIYTRP